LKLHSQKEYNQERPHDPFGHCKPNPEANFYTETLATKVVQLLEKGQSLLQFNMIIHKS